ncbi:MAG TPA: RdgB/HAM1 family non-canonical purine NTP pyrophosphatase [Armatimonadota bacterium]|nr:RdgB/HAM1 family non-canonical purine NTP pyrophosphatase [Armatimonadota bacterium]
MPHPRRLVIATKNPGKVREFRALLAGLPLELSGAEEMPEVDETGATFAENAELKARAAAEWSGEWALADDSGLEVDALGGAPGVYSNRFAGEGTTEEQRNRRLLELLAEVPPPGRTARYRAVVVVAAPDGRVWMSEGACEGVLLDAPRGENGFGYDPLFFVPEFGMTMAELDPHTKNRISHRARALAGATPILTRLCGRAEPPPEEPQSAV